MTSHFKHMMPLGSLVDVLKSKENPALGTKGLQNYALAGFKLFFNKSHLSFRSCDIGIFKICKIDG